MRQLTGIDAAFLAMETPGVYGHVGSVCLLDPSTAPRPLTLQSVRETVADRLPLLPPLRRRLVDVPLGLDQPYWIDDPEFEIDFHVRELALPAPGSDQQLAEQVARLHGRPLDRKRPLWEFYLVSGLAGDRLAIYTKVHHAAVDGVAGSDLLAALLDLSSAGRDLAPPPASSAAHVPRPLGMLVRSGYSLTAQPWRAVRVAAGVLRALPEFATNRGRPTLPVIDRLLRAEPSGMLSQPGFHPPRTPFNRSISPHRRWAFRSVSLPQVKQVKRAAGTTVNDVVMALCAGGLRRWLADHGGVPDSPLVAAVPVSVRAAAEQDAHGNRVSAMLAALPTDLADPRLRLTACQQAMSAAKEQLRAVRTSLVADVAGLVSPAIADQVVRLAVRLRLIERIAPFNLIISNVPGPNMRLYFAGAELLACYPLSAVVDGQGLNITVMSYRDGMHFGLTACRQLVPDLDRLAGYCAEELDVLTEALRPALDNG